MKTCGICKGKVTATTAIDELEVDGRKFSATVPALKCGACGEVLFEGRVIEAFELAVARELGRTGASSGPALKFMRKALGFRAADLAPLLGVAAETLSRWETGERAADRGALGVVGAIVEDRIEGRTTTLDRLRALANPKRSGTRAIKLDVVMPRPAKRSA